MRSPLALLAALSLTACTAGAEQVSAPRSNPSAAGIIVIDGDTVEIDGERIRLSTIDAPEMPPKAKCQAEAAAALAAKAALEDYVRYPEHTTIVREGRDRYGRTLARVYVGDDDELGDFMLKEGLAQPWRGRRVDWCGPQA
jgi:micrococcal nuclease